MAWGHYEQNYVYNYDINAVLDAVMRAAAQVKLKLKKADRAAYKVKFSTGISLFTWGEEVFVTLGVLPDGKTGAPCGACREFMVQLMPGKYKDTKNS